METALSEDSISLIPKRFDVGIRVGALDDAALVSRPLGPMRLMLCASLSYSTVRGEPGILEELSSHALLQLQNTGREQATPFFVRAVYGRARSLQMLQLKGRFVCNDFRALHQACVDGLGIAQLPQPQTNARPRPFPRRLLH